jgi:hypothetical protein
VTDLLEWFSGGQSASVEIYLASNYTVASASLLRLPYGTPSANHVSSLHHILFSPCTSNQSHEGERSI